MSDTPKHESYLGFMTLTQTLIPTISQYKIDYNLYQGSNFISMHNIPLPLTKYQLTICPWEISKQYIPTFSLPY